MAHISTWTTWVLADVHLVSHKLQLLPLALLFLCHTNPACSTYSPDLLSASPGRELSLEAQTIWLGPLNYFKPWPTQSLLSGLWISSNSCPRPSFTQKNCVWNPNTTIIENYHSLWTNKEKGTKPNIIYQCDSEGAKGHLLLGSTAHVLALLQ